MHSEERLRKVILISKVWIRGRLDKIRLGDRKTNEEVLLLSRKGPIMLPNDTTKPGESIETPGV